MSGVRASPSAYQDPPVSKSDEVTGPAFLPERAEDRTEQILIRLDDGRLVIRTRPLRGNDRGRRLFFERGWPDFLTRAVFEAAG